jgi:predicted permease
MRVLGVDPGFDAASSLIADVRPVMSQGEAIPFFDELVTRVEALPGVIRACAINNVPLDNRGPTMTFVAEGRTDADRISALPMGVTDGCFDALRIPIVAGRDFDRRELESVAILNESMARALFPGVPDPTGRRVHIGLVAGPLFTIVGVVRDIRASALDSANTRQVWMSASRGWPMPERLIVRSAVPPQTLARPLRAVLGDLAPGLALANMRTMPEIVSSATASRRFVLALLTAFAVIALALSAVGIYGTLAHQVGQRRREIGIRVALGARRADVARAIAGRTFAGVVAGIAGGILGGRLLSSLIESQLYGWSADDTRVHAGVAAFVVLIAALACWAPARRATRIDPVDALRRE